MDYILEHHSALLVGLVLLAPLLLSFPSLVAVVRGLPDKKHIMVLNAAGLVFFSAWFAALTWASTGRRDVSYLEAVLRRKWRYLGIAVGSGTLMLIFGAYYAGSGVYAAVTRPKIDEFTVEQVSMGPIALEITATGRLKPLKIVQVSSQVNGAVLRVNADVNDFVKAGDVIARIDPASYEARVQQARAQLDRALAARADAIATGVRAQANYDLAKAGANRKNTLFERGFLTRADLESATAGLADGRAQLGQSQASRASASAMVAQAESELKAARLDLERTFIRSPVTGTVMVRRVEPGQAIVSSFQATTLFEIAEDLSRMRVEAQVDEADIGRVHVGQVAVFTVDSFPGETFRGLVVTIRKSPDETQGSISYPVSIDVINPEQKLLSGMTADVRIAEMRKPAVLRVPAAALSFEPKGAPQTSGDRVYRMVDGRPARVSTGIGVRNDQWAEVVDSDLRPGDQVVIASKDSEE